MPRNGKNNNSFIDNFRRLDYMTDIDHTISTGNKFVDKTVGTYGSKIIGMGVKNPAAKLIVKAAGKVYPYVEKASANIARAKAAYDETYRKK